MDSTDGEPARSWRGRRWWVAPLVVCIVIGVGLGVDRSKRLDAVEGQVVREALEAVTAGSDATITQGVDLTPCWWYCEDRAVEAWAEVAFDPDVDPAERCELLSSRVADLTDAQPRDLTVTVHFRSCFRSWNFTARGRSMRIDIDVTTDPSDPVSIYIANESARRAFLPQG